MSVAVVMTIFNTAAPWVAEAVASVRPQLRTGDELIVVDDGSTDAAVIAECDRIPNLIRTANAGIGPASNIGVAAATAPLILRLDADDRLMPDTLARLAEHLLSNPQVDAVTGGMHYIRPDGSRFADVSYRPMHSSATHENRMVHSGCMFRRSLWERAGGYPNERAADWAFWCACEKAGARFSVIPHFVIERRIHPGSTSFRWSGHVRHYWQLAKAK